jgi:protein-tyrosine phosphatase
VLPPVWMQLAGPAARPSGRPDFTWLDAQLCIGEYPTPDDPPWLRRELGVNAVLSLQDDADLHHKGLELGDLERAYAAAGVVFRRVPITDGDTADLAAKLDVAVHALAHLVATGATVYVHCNAGLNRAPSVAVAYLHACRGMPLGEARDFVKARRACVPYMSVLERHYGEVGES